MLKCMLCLSAGIFIGFLTGAIVFSCLAVSSKNDENEQPKRYKKRSVWGRSLFYCAFPSARAFHINQIQRKEENYEATLETRFGFAADRPIPTVGCIVYSVSGARKRERRSLEDAWVLRLSALEIQLFRRQNAVGLAAHFPVGRGRETVFHEQRGRSPCLLHGAGQYRHNK